MNIIEEYFAESIYLQFVSLKIKSSDGESFKTFTRQEKSKHTNLEKFDQ